MSVFGEEPEFVLGCARGSLVTVLEPVLDAHRVELFSLSAVSFGRGGLCVAVEQWGSRAQRLSTRDAAVDITTCCLIARDAGLALEVAQLFRTPCTLEVSSPGLERPLRDTQDLIRFEGEQAKLKLKTPLEGQTVLVGRLGALSAEGLLLEGEKQSFVVPVADLLRASLLFTHPSSYRKKGSLRLRKG